MDKPVSLDLVRQLVLVKENSLFTPAVLRLKIDLVSHFEEPMV